MGRMLEGIGDVDVAIGEIIEGLGRILNQVR
jgi:hypothetical protein